MRSPWHVYGLAALTGLLLGLILAPLAPVDCAALLDHARHTGEASDYATAEALCGPIY